MDIEAAQVRAVEVIELPIVQGHPRGIGHHHSFHLTILGIACRGVWVATSLVAQFIDGRIAIEGGIATTVTAQDRIEEIGRIRIVLAPWRQNHGRFFVG